MTAKRAAAAAAPPLSDGEAKRFKTAVRSLMDELISAEHELAVMRRKLRAAGDMLAEAGTLLSPHPCSVDGCEKDALVRLHATHYVCLPHFSSADSSESPTYECPACKQQVSDGIEIAPLAKRRSRLSLAAVESRCAGGFCKSEAWRANTRRSLATLLALDADQLFGGYPDDPLPDYNSDRKRLCNYDSAARPGKPVVDFEWNGSPEEAPASEPPADDPDQCAQQID